MKKLGNLNYHYRLHPLPHALCLVPLAFLLSVSPFTRFLSPRFTLFFLFTPCPLPRAPYLSSMSFLLQDKVIEIFLLQDN
jgi:hypothetical protein